MSTPKHSSKLSAFSVFKTKRTSSLVDVNSGTPKKLPRKSISANVTPENSKQNSVSSLINKFRAASEKRKDKQSAKDIKKALKSLSKNGSGSFITSKVSSLKKSREDGVQLKSIKLKGSNVINQSPVKTGPDKKKSPPKPLPRKGSIRPKPDVLKIVKDNDDSRGLRRRSTTLSPKLPPRPSKRRKLSNDSVSGGSDRDSVIMTPPHGEEIRMPLPVHPSVQSNGTVPKMFDSAFEAKKLFECMIHPINVSKFFSELWEKKPLLVKRHIPSYNDGWFSSGELDRILREEQVDFGRNIDVVTFIDDKRETHNPPGRAYAPLVWDFYQNGCSIRLLNPQTYSKNVWKFLSSLQEYFGCMAGANVYLTPPNSQGFAPHWDDIEAFILQLEGKKRWRLYSPRSDNETLPRFSSGNFTDKDIGEPTLDVILEAGDLLYFPRGTIHQGNTVNGEHSLHITVSSMQRNTWGDFLLKLLPQTIENAIEEDIEFRYSLPTDYLNYMGVAHSDLTDQRRTKFLRRLESLMTKLLSHAPVDETADQMGKQFCQDTLPPVLTDEEKIRTVHGHGERWCPQTNSVINAVELEPDTCVKLIRKSLIRLVMEGFQVFIYHNLENTRVWHEVEPRCFEIKPNLAPAVEYLLHSYPNYKQIDSFPLETIDEKMELASIFYDKGLLMTEDPLEIYDDSESEDAGALEIE
ncbi:DgyrCDS11720 [Dimorphilus gyrociliatus]|uniref:Bifunctional lysine-specific demethylase and histidyl-hydroxylase n=1 Tax=Dimorphilus gyrociliatus TaxID=2664684 RepID=A0A7I8W477_9ANNE|nr:DgyrCDS11720 [Dimorphilus gyrociliatus]